MSREPAYMSSPAHIELILSEKEIQVHLSINKAYDLVLTICQRFAFPFDLFYAKTMPSTLVYQLHSSKRRMRRYRGCLCVWLILLSFLPPLLSCYILQVKKGDEPHRPTRKQAAKTRFVKAGGGVDV